MPVPSLIVARATPKVAGVPQADGGFGWRGVSSPARLDLPISVSSRPSLCPFEWQTAATRGEPHGLWRGRPGMRASDMRAGAVLAGGQPRRFPFAEKHRQ
jgi:hypothetical protein